MSRTSPLPLLLAAAAALAAGLLAGAARLGWDNPAAGLAGLHGPLMVCGFFGTVIGVERAVALARKWAWAAPLATAAGGLLLIAGFEPAGAAALALGSLVFLAGALAVLRRQPELFTAVMAVGAAAWAAGSVAWAAGAEVAQVVPLWAAFLVLTIAGERLELSRFLAPWRWRGPAVLPPLLLLAAGAGMAATGHEPAWPLVGAGLLLLAAWSAANDLARRTLRQTGLTRYVAVCVLSGYVWLAAAGLLALRLAVGEAGPAYDAVLHALFVGFVFAMVFGHAPVILPAVAGIRLPFRPYFYGPLALLHLSLALRLAGDLAGRPDLRAWGGLANALTIALFIATVVGTAVRAGKTPPLRPIPPAGVREG
jgi:hypothetical protein